MEAKQKRLYVVGLCFDLTLTEVLLLKKTHPEWQNGKWNGPGGLIQENETPHQAVSREFLEETGILIKPEEWTMAISYEGMDNPDEEYSIYYLKALLSNKVRPLFPPPTDELPKWLMIESLMVDNYWPNKCIPHDCILIPNLKWIIPAALDLQALEIHVYEKRWVENCKVEFKIATDPVRVTQEEELPFPDGPYPVEAFRESTSEVPLGFPRDEEDNLKETPSKKKK